MFSGTRDRNPKAVLQDCARKFVLATNGWPVFRSAYRGAYRLAAHQVGRLALSHAGIAALYARNSYATGLWSPGRSDIDLTVVWRAPSHREIARFNRDYASLRRRFPMLGEVEMIDTRHIEAWTAYGFTGLQSRHWLKLCGDHDFESRYEGDESIDRLRHAIAVYRWQFLRYFWERSCPEHQLQRVASKVLRILGSSESVRRAPSDLLSLCLSEISSAVDRVAPAECGEVVDCSRMLNPTPRPPLWSKMVVHAAEVDAVIGLRRDPTSRHVLIRPATDIRKIESEFRGAVVLDRKSFLFYLTHVDCLEYFTLLQERTILHGIDPLGGESTLRADVLRETVCQYSVDMLTFPYQENLDRIPASQFQDLLYGWFLRTLRYFEDGVMEFDYYALRSHFGERHPEELDRFALLRGIASEVSHHLSSRGHGRDPVGQGPREELISARSN